MDVLNQKIEQLENQLSDVSNERISDIEERLHKVIKKLDKKNKQSKRIKKILSSFKSSAVNQLDSNENHLNAINEQRESDREKTCENENLNHSSIVPLGTKENDLNATNEQQDSTQKERVKKIKESAHKFISSLSVHGVSRIVKTDNLVIKLVWAIMILISVSFGLYTISRSINDYSRYDVITNVERIDPKSVTFPAITICTEGFYRLLRRTFALRTILQKHKSSNILVPNPISFVSY